MNVKLLIFILGGILVGNIAGSLVSHSDHTEDGISERVLQSRWYTQEQVKRGRALYKENCAQCHQADASGHANVIEGNSAPALNGTEHTWHHPLSSLRRTVKQGGIPLGGTMPSFSDKLTNEEIDDILAWVQSHWSSDIYTAWEKRNKQSY